MAVALAAASAVALAAARAALAAALAAADAGARVGAGAVDDAGVTRRCRGGDSGSGTAHTVGVHPPLKQLLVEEVRQVLAQQRQQRRRGRWGVRVRGQGGGQGENVVAGALLGGVKKGAAAAGVRESRVYLCAAAAAAVGEEADLQRLRRSV